MDIVDKLIFVSKCIVQYFYSVDQMGQTFSYCKYMVEVKLTLFVRSTEILCFNSFSQV